MICLIISILLISVLFKFTGFILKICGKILGSILGIVFYIGIGILALVGVGFGLAVIVMPVVIIVGVIALCRACAK